MNTVIETTADGSPTLYLVDLDEHYHSVKGALAESLHVYVDTGWRKASTDSKAPIRVFEVGFGTGMNAAVTAKVALETGILTEYFAVELFPLPKETTDVIAMSVYSGYREILRRVNESPWDTSVEINPCFILHKIEADLLTMNLPDKLDAVYFDAFAPEKQPEIWDETVFRRLFHAMTPGGVLTTYCAKGSIRRMLQGVGFVTERLPGPPDGKREILRASVPTGTQNDTTFASNFQ